uniref:Transposase n=1 Tax=Candidatus Kentrum sp. TC TaxID=2126339 RepID=A0A450YIJ6_9GAMM|nr:MAG: hypothetical protein BECKTC1821E_GA0114239_101113 [Candidatus Kentron sp. TC]
MRCPEHGVVTASAPWAEPNSRFTAMFEALPNRLVEGGIHLGGIKVRRQEHKAPMAEGREDLEGSKYERPYDQANRMLEKRRKFSQLREIALKTARAWAIEELAMSLWGYAGPGRARPGNGGYRGPCVVVSNR